MQEEHLSIYCVVCSYLVLPCSIYFSIPNTEYVIWFLEYIYMSNEHTVNYVDSWYNGT